MRLFLLIIASVLGGYILLGGIRRRRAKKHFNGHDKFQQTVLQSSNNLRSKEHLHNLGETQTDPLLENYIESEATEDESDNIEMMEDKAHAIAELPELNSEALYEAESSFLNWDIEKDQNKRSEFIAMTILPKQQNDFFAGASLSAHLTKCSFYYGKQKLFHRHLNDNPSNPILFSVASIVEPGSFEIETMIHKNFSGILIFMLLPLSDPNMVFEKMLTSARQLAASLNGQLCDAERCQLDAQTIQYYRERIKENSLNNMTQLR